MRFRLRSRIINTILLGLILIIISKGIAHADVIWTPNDDFYLNNAEQCDTLGRSFTANSTDGSITLWKSPISKTKIATYENGTLFYVSVTFTDEKDETWGVIEIDGKTGWTKMKDLLLVYDNISFSEDHEKEFQEYNGEFDNYVIIDPIILWTYPGSGEIRSKLSKVDDKQIPFESTYTDPDGSQWGYIPYYYSHKGWVCLNDPTNENLPVNKGTVTTTISPLQGDIQDNILSPDIDANNHMSSVLMLLAIAIAVLITVTGIIIRVVWKKNKKTY